MSNSIFYLERRVDLKDSFYNILKDLEDTPIKLGIYETMPLYQCINKNIKTWPYRHASNSIEMFADYHGFSISDRTEEDILFSVELFANLLKWTQKCEAYKKELFGKFQYLYNVDQECERCFANIEYILEMVNMKLRVHSLDNQFPCYIVSKRDAAVDAVLENVPELADVLLSYLDVRNQNDYNAKRIILKQIADYMEPRRPEYNGTAYHHLCKNLFKVFNECGIRHNNDRQIILPLQTKMALYDSSFKVAIHLLQKATIDDFQQFVSTLSTENCE